MDCDVRANLELDLPPSAPLGLDLFLTRVFEALQDSLPRKEKESPKR